MNVLQVMKSDAGGAAVAALRLNAGLIAEGVDSKALVHSKTTSNSSVMTYTNVVQRTWGKAASFFSRQLDQRIQRPEKQWGRDLSFPTPTTGRILRRAPDIINLHWLGSGFLGDRAISRLAMTETVVWTLHDMRAFTGGCHYDEGCEKYKLSCGSCPQLRRCDDRDMSFRSLHRKRELLARSNLTIVCPSKWLADCAAKSQVFRDLPIENIPYGIDLNLFRPLDKGECRRAIGVPLDSRVVLFGAANSTGDSRKGFDLLLESISNLRESRQADRIFLLIFGTTKSYQELGLGLPGKSLGAIKSEEQIVEAFSAADVFVAPSRQDNLPNTVIESLSCGTPVVSFRIGGMPDMIDHQQNGFLAAPYSPSELAEGIMYCLNPAHHSLYGAARKKAETSYSSTAQATQYLNLYRRLVARR